MTDNVVDRARARRPKAGAPRPAAAPGETGSVRTSPGRTPAKVSVRRQKLRQAVGPLPTVPARSERTPQALARGGWLQCTRLLRAWARDPETTVQTLIYPGFTLVLFRIVFGNTVSSYSGQASVYGLVPMLMLVSAMSGSMVGGMKLMAERDSGLLSRMATMPVHRAAGLVGRIAAESLRVLLTSLFVLAVGFALGFRFTQGPLAAVAMLGLPILFGAGFAMFVVSLAATGKTTTLISIVGIGNTLLMFFNSGFVPVSVYPGWLQGTVQNQPMSCVIDTMRGLAVGGPVATPLIKSLVWSLGLLAVFTYPAIRSLRKAAETH